MSEPTTTGPWPVAVIGAGVISEQHLRYLTGRRDVRVEAICDLSESMADVTARRFGIPRPMTDHHRMLEDVKPRVAHVLTPAHTHVRIVEDCLEAGAHVVVEKPAAPTRAELLNLHDRARAKNLFLVEDHNYRFNRPVRDLEECVREGRLGEIRDVEIRLSLHIRTPEHRYADPHLPHSSHGLPAGVIHEFLPHLCYLAQRFLPDLGKGPAGEGDTVRSVWRNHGGDGPFKYDDFDAILVRGPAHARLRFSSSCAPESFSLVVRGTRGEASTDLFQPYFSINVPRPGPKQLTPTLNLWSNGWSLVGASLANLGRKIRQHASYEGLTEFLRRTYDALRSGGTPPVTFEDMDRCSRLIETLLAEDNRA